MKKKSAILFFLSLFCLSCFGQVAISVNTHNAPFDSIAIQQYKKSFETVLVQKNSDVVVFKRSELLKPGLYFLAGDHKIIGTFIISDNKKQTFSIGITEDSLTFDNSADNNQYSRYLREIQRFEQQLDSLQQVYAQAAKSMPQYMLAPLVAQLTEEATRINNEKREYQTRTGSELAGTLTATIARASMQIPDVPDSLKNQTAKVQQFLLSHFFDNFPWEDPRVFNTPYGYQRVQEFVSLLVKFNKKEYGSYVMNALEAAKVDTASYFALFDQMEPVIGDHASPMRIEPIYIQMLKNMQALPKLPEYRKRHCKYELSKIDMNHEGDVAPDFIFVTNLGDTTTLHDIKSDYVLLYLQHPTCPTCQKIRKMIADFPVLNQAIASGRLKVLMVYFEDEPDVWNAYIQSSEANPSYLHGWNFDQSIENKNLYDTRAIPYMFLLDRDKRILKKNVLETELENEIRKLHLSY